MIEIDILSKNVEIDNKNKRFEFFSIDLKLN